MPDHRTRHTLLSQRITNTVCPTCGADLIQFVELGLTRHLDASQAPINRTPLDYHRAGRSVWRLNLATGRWRYDPASPRGEKPVHLIHDCPNAGRSQAQEGAQA